MKRNVIEIDQEKCIGCGLCTKACHQEAIKLIDGKATLVSDSYCDGLGMCLPNCPVDAIKLVEKETDAFDITRKDFALKKGGGCPGSRAVSLKPFSATAKKDSDTPRDSMLGQWPVQLHLVNPQAPYLQNANLLIAADCTAFAYGDFHRKFMKNKVTLIGCPKLDDTQAYVDKLEAIFRMNDVASITVLRMSVPCCGGLPRLVKEALQKSGSIILYAEVTISTEGQILG